MADKKPRIRKAPKHKSLRLTRQKISSAKPVTGSVVLFKQTWQVIRNNKKQFFGISFISFVLLFVLVQGLSGSQAVVELKDNIKEILGENANSMVTTVSLFAYLIGSAGSSASEAGAVYQMFIVVTVSLAVIWSVRQVQAGERPRIRDGFYKGMYPLIPFILILGVIGLQLVPLLLGNLIYSTVVNNGLAGSSLEAVLWLLLFICLALLSAYMVISSIFGLYIVTLPDMTPMTALRSARNLVLHRRLKIGLRVLALPVMLLVLSAIILLPLILVSAPVAGVIFLLLGSFALVATHIYMYLLYKALL